jgi:uncharacterized iron-regulated membrane protein
VTQYHRDTDTTYVYESESYYDPSRKQSRSRRKLIGKLDKETGEVISSELYADSAAKTKVQGWIYSLHVGSWGGVVTRVLAFLAALLGASLPLTGYWLCMRRLNLKKKKN